MSRPRALRLIVPTLLLLAGSGVALAQSQPPPPRQSAEPRERPSRPERPERRDDLPESVRRVERETGGEVLRAEPMQRDGREVYRFKVLTADGRVRVMQDDPDARRDDDGNRGRRGNRGDEGNEGNGNNNDDARPRGGQRGRNQRPSRDSDGEPPQF